MTRFARAKGSKASNERREEEATPWHVMRQQLAEQLSNHQAQGGTNTQSYNLKEILSNGAKPQNKEVWADFGDKKSKVNNNLKSNKGKKGSEKVIKKRKHNKDGESVENVSRIVNNEIIVNSNKKLKLEMSVSTTSEVNLPKDKKIIKEATLIGLKEKSKLKYPVETQVVKRFTVNNIDKSVDSGIGSKGKDIIGKTRRKFNSSKKHKLKSVNCIKSDSENIKQNKNLLAKNVFVETLVGPVLNSTESSDSRKKFPNENVGSVETCDKLEQVKKKSRKIKKNNNLEVQNVKHSFNEKIQKSCENTNVLNSSSKDKKSANNGKVGIVKSVTQNSSSSTRDSRPYFDNGYRNKFDNNHFQRNNFSKYSQDRNFQTIIANGREIHVVKYQGFQVKKDDAEELKKLRKKLLAQKIPKEKLETIMKLERRKAEKALAREKKKVCYHCRQFGHNFSDCPEIKDSDMVKTGVCFKCGSLEHSHFECKVHQQQEYRHAVCFVCKEQGHIARQCPLNSQGLYPKGGSCHLCGEVTHLRKDCPKAVEEKSTKSVTVDTLKDGTVEDIDRDKQSKEIGTNKKKIVMFK